MPRLGDVWRSSPYVNGIAVVFNLLAEYKILGDLSYHQ
jgi:hypothetical protein